MLLRSHDIGDYLDRDQKLKIVKDLKTFSNRKLDLTTLFPNEQGDWLNPRNDGFGNFISLGNKEKETKGIENSFFKPIFSSGIVTARDNWVWNFGLDCLKSNVSNTIEFYNGLLWINKRVHLTPDQNHASVFVILLIPACPFLLLMVDL